MPKATADKQTNKNRTERQNKRTEMFDLKKSNDLLEERLVEHDECRKEVQRELEGIRSKAEKEADSLEEKINGELLRDYGPKEEEILGLIEKLNREEGDLGALMKQAQGILAERREYGIHHYKSAGDFVNSYILVISSAEGEKEVDPNDTESAVSKLQEHLDKTHESLTAARDKLTEVCDEWRREAGKMTNSVNERLGTAFSQEDARIQEVVKVIRENLDSENADVVKELTRKGVMSLLKNQKYSLRKGDSLASLDLTVTNEVISDFPLLECMKPAGFAASLTENGCVSISFAPLFSKAEEGTLEELGVSLIACLAVWKKGSNSAVRTFTKKYDPWDSACDGGKVRMAFSSIVTSGEMYCLKVRVERGRSKTEWSEEAEVTTPEFRECCVWRRPESIDGGKSPYAIDKESRKAATNVLENWACAVTGAMPLPQGKTVSWGIKLLNFAGKYDERGVFVGVVPSGVVNAAKGGEGLRCGWHFECCDSKLRSGPPHNFSDKKYGPKRLLRKIVRTGSVIGVTMDTALGALSFSVDRKSYGVAYERITLDKPLVPCVVLMEKGDSVGIDFAEVRDSAPASKAIPVPPNITAKSVTWSSINLAWDGVKGASFYQIEADGSEFLDGSTTERFTKCGFLPETEHAFRVRAVKGNLASEWSDVVKGWTLKDSFETSGWKECPCDADKRGKYSIGEKNPRITTKIDKYDWCTIIGNKPLPLNKVTSWNIKILNSGDNNGNGIFIGVAPSDINQNGDDNFTKCGWHFNCHGSTLCSGPPYNYNKKNTAQGKKMDNMFAQETVLALLWTRQRASSLLL